jgi:hypothetical protein
MDRPLGWNGTRWDGCGSPLTSRGVTGTARRGEGFSLAEPSLVK